MFNMLQNTTVAGHASVRDIYSVLRKNGMKKDVESVVYSQTLHI